MKRKIVWVVVSGLMVLSLVMASCAPAAVEKEEEVVKEEVAEKVEKEVVAPTVEKPKYGGVLKVCRTRDITDFDDVVGVTYTAITTMVTNETLWAGDWTKGPAGGYGTNETTWGHTIDIWDHYAGYIAESWELPTQVEGELATIIYHIRQGVHFALNPDSEASRLVGGREMTVDDVLFSLTQQITDTRAFIYRTNAELRVAKITSPAPWTVKMEIPWETFESALNRFGAVYIVPPEVVAKYGTMIGWKVSVGTGPFMLTDWVPGSAATLVRNPNYWMKDPIGPGKGNQLPYLDGVKILIIPDQSTVLAALRTAKVDQAGMAIGMDIPWEDKEMLVKLTPQLMSKARTFRVHTAVCLKLDRPPFNDIRVRRALMLAIDFHAIARDYLAGDPEVQLYNLPIGYAKEVADAYLGLDDPEMPESFRELFTYNPEKARALLAEAGYPKGFKTNLILATTVAEIDYFSIYKDMWSKVGIDLELRPKETGAKSAIEMNKSFDGMITRGIGGHGVMYRMICMRGVSVDNQGEIDDPVVNEYFDKIQVALVTSQAEANRLYRENLKYALPQVWWIPMVGAPAYSVWWPWLKNYSGEISTGYTHRHFYNWVWLDQELKKAMGY